MKRFGILLLGASLLVPTGARAQDAGAEAGQVWEASANWVVRRAENAGHFRFVEAYEWVDPVEGASTIVDYGRVCCGIGEKGRVIVTSCKVTTRIVFTRPDRFHVDPLVRHATLTFVENGVTQTARWTTKQSSPAMTWALHGDGEYLVLNAGMRSTAQARGRVMGDRFSTKAQTGFATLRRGGSGEVFVGLDAGPKTHVYEHRSRTRAAAWSWVRRLVRSL